MAKLEILNVLGLTFDIIGFFLISKGIVIEEKRDEDNQLILANAFGKPMIKDPLVTTSYFKISKGAKWGFWLIIIGYFLQILANLNSFIFE
jgi:uncharacterized membrane protein